MVFFRIGIVVIVLAVVMLLWWNIGESKRSQKIDDLPAFVTCRSGTLAMLSSKVNSPVTHESTR